MTWRRRLVVLGLAGALALGVLRWFDVHPIELTVTDPETAGVAAEEDVDADVLLVVDHAVIARSAAAGTFEALDLSYGWANVFRQEIGRAALVDAAHLVPERLARSRVVVVTASAVAAAPPASFDAFVRAGGTVLVERPDDAWCTAAGVTCGRPLAAERITTLPDSVAGGFVAELLVAPLPTTCVPLASASSDVVPRLSVDGRPAWTSRAVGRGLIAATGLDVGRLVTALQQGVPDARGFGVSNRYPERLSPYRQTCDLVADERMLEADVPYADLVERLVLHLIEGAAPLPRWWLFEGVAPGAYIATHDEESMGDTAPWMADAERSWGVSGSDYVIAGSNLTPTGAARLGGDDRTLGLHYVATLANGAPRHELGIGRILPFVKRFSLSEQAAAFEELTGARPRTNRNHYLLWGATWAGEFRRLAAAGIELDTSYGPDVDSRGYLFGTGLPFRALDRNGLPLPVEELPLLSAENLGGADREFLFGLLQRSAERHHETVTTLFHPNVFLWRPDPAIYRQWRDSFREARRLGLWITHVDALRAHEERRRSSPLTSVWDGAVLRVAAAVDGDGLTVAVPLQASGRPVVRVTVDGATHTARAVVTTVGGELLLVPLDAGAHALEFDYDDEAPR